MSSQQYKSPKEKKKANKKIEVDYHKLRKKRLAKDFQKVNWTAWNAMDVRRRLPAQKSDMTKPDDLYYILKKSELH